MSIVSERRDVSGFSRVSLKGFGDIVLDQGNREELVVEAEADILPKIRSEVSDGTLLIELTQDWVNWMFRPPKPVTYRLTVKEISEVAIAGAGNLDANKIKAQSLGLKITGSGEIRIGALEAFSLAVAISGSGKMEAAGKVENEQVRVHGAGTVDLAAVECENATVKIAGTGKVKVNAAGGLDVGVAGYGEVSYVGSPKISQRITGAGKVESLDAP